MTLTLKLLADGETMLTLNACACHLETYLSYPSILLHHPMHAVNFPQLPTNHYCSIISVHTGHIFIVVGQYACVTYLLLYSIMHV